MRHYSEVELLERYYIPSSAKDEVGAHLASCQPCAERFELLSGKLRDSACASVASIDGKPDTFWIRQRMGIERKIAEQSARGRKSGKTARMAAVAATLTVLFGGGLLYRVQMARWNAPLPAAVMTSPAPDAAALDTSDLLAAIESTDDAWESEELKPFGEAVQWESWMSSPANSPGGTL